jgi:hypothetical protein
MCRLCTPQPKCLLRTHRGPMAWWQQHATRRSRSSTGLPPDWRHRVSHHWQRRRVEGWVHQCMPSLGRLPPLLPHFLRPPLPLLCRGRYRSWQVHGNEITYREALRVFCPNDISSFLTKYDIVVQVVKGQFYRLQEDHSHGFLDCHCLLMTMTIITLLSLPPHSAPFYMLSGSATTSACT